MIKFELHINGKFFIEYVPENQDDFTPQDGLTAFENKNRLKDLFDSHCLYIKKANLEEIIIAGDYTIYVVYISELKYS